MYIKFFNWDKAKDTYGVYQDFNNILNKLVDFRFREPYKLICSKYFEDRTTDKDLDNTVDLFEPLANVYSDIEEEKFKKEGYYSVPCVLYGYNFGSSYGSGRTYTLQSVEEMERTKEAYPAVKVNPILFFDVYLEEDKMLKFLEGTPLLDIFKKELEKLKNGNSREN